MGLTSSKSHNSKNKNIANKLVRKLRKNIHTNVKRFH